MFLEAEGNRRKPTWTCGEHAVTQARDQTKDPEATRREHAKLLAPQR